VDKDQIRDRDRLKDGTGDGVPDRDRTQKKDQTGKPAKALSTSTPTADKDQIRDQDRKKDGTGDRVPDRDRKQDQTSKPVK
jgi:hypothetical protein